MVWPRGAQIKLTVNNCEHTKAEIAFIFAKLTITLQESRFQEILAKNRRKKKITDEAATLLAVSR